MDQEAEPSTAQDRFDLRTSDLGSMSAVRRGSEEEGFRDARDEYRADMRVSRTTAAITPQVFTEVLRRQEAAFRPSTVQVESVDQQGALQEPASSQTAAPTGPPRSFGPAGQTSLDGSA